MSQIVTGEAVALNLRVARIGSRSVALFIDIVVRLVAAFGLALLFGQVGSLDGAAAAALVLVLYIAVWLGYPVAFETLWGGRTPGKAAMGLRVVRDDGGPVRFRHALTRGLLGAIVELPGFTFFVAPIISSLMSERGQRLGDRAAGTVVIQERVPTRAMPVVPMPPPLAHWASTLDLSRIGNDLALGIRGYFERAHELSPQARDQLGYSLTNAVVAAISPAPPPGAPPWAILAAVLAERRRRDEYRLHQQRAAAGQPPPWQQPSQPGSWQGPTQPGWGSLAPASSWQASAPPTGTPTSVGPPPGVGQTPYYGPRPPVPAGPTPVPAPAPVPSTEPPPDGGFQLPS
ncbi:MAG: RDD family protein [Actinomycetota bacterium]